MSSNAVCRVASLALWCASATALGGCYSMHPVNAPLLSELSRDTSAEVLVTGRQGLSVRLVHAHIEHDSLKGREVASQGTRAIAPTDIDTIETSSFDTGRTVLITVAIVSAVLLTLYLMLIATLANADL